MRTRRSMLIGAVALCLIDPASGATLAQEPETPAVATGTFTIAEGAEHTESDEGRRWRDQGAEAWGWLEMSDPRVSGTFGLLIDFEELGRTSSGDGAVLLWGSGLLENDDGSWQGPMAGFVSEDRWRMPSWLIGSGAFDGLTAFLSLETLAGEARGLEVVALIYDGDPPRIVATGIENPQPATVAEVGSGAITGTVTIDGVTLGQKGNDADEYFFSDGTGVTILDTQGGGVPLFAPINIVGQVASDEIDVSSWIPLEAEMADLGPTTEAFMAWVARVADDHVDTMDDA